MKEEWLTIIIILLMIGIALDGYRRMRIARREKIRLSRNAKKADNFDGEPTHSSSEFPSGGARVAAYRKEEDAQSLNKTVKQSYKSKRVTVGAPQRIPEQVTLNLEESVPMLMDSVEMENQSSRQKTSQHKHAADDGSHAYAQDDDDYRDEYEQDDYAESDYDQDEAYARQGVQEEDDEDYLHDDHREPSIGDFDALDDDVEPVQHYRSEPQSKLFPEPKPAVAKEPQKKDSQKKDIPKKDADKKAVRQKELQEEQAYKEPDEVLIMNIMARPGTRFNGPELLDALMEEGLKLGAMDIFHRHLDNDGDAPVIFSLANMVVPGTFNLAEMDNFVTPGVSLFLSLPVEGESLAAYDDLARTARNLAKKLDGELKDENRSVMTNQTIEHGRQRVVEYERKRKLARA